MKTNKRQVMKQIVVFFTLLLLAFGGNKALAQDKKDWGNIYVEAGISYSVGSHTGEGIFENISVGYRIPESSAVVYLEWGGSDKETRLGYPMLHTGMVSFGYDVLRFKNASFAIEPRLGVGFATGGFGAQERVYRFAAEAGLMLRYEINWCYFGFHGKFVGMSSEWGKTSMYEFMTGFTWGIRF